MKNSMLSWKIQVAFIITGIFVGLLVTAQFRSAIPSSSFPLDELHAQQDLIKSFTADQAILKTQIVNLRKQIETKQDLSQLSIAKNNLDTLSQLKREIGLEVIKGDGVEIILEDGLILQDNTDQTLDQFQVQAADLRDMVNLLFSAQSDAVSINDQRLISSSPITSVGNTILVNNYHLLPPFSIKAIGSPEIILPRLNDLQALPDLLKRSKSHKIRYTFGAKKGLVVPVFNSDFRLQFTKEIDPLSS